MQRERNWHYLTNAELESLFGSDTATGLGEKEVAARLGKKKNKIWNVKGAGVKKYVAETLIDLTTLLLVLTVFVAAVFDNTGSALLICIMLIICRCLRVATYIKAQRVLEENAKAALPRAKVVRGGNVRIVPADMIVPGDVIILDAGDTVPCDIRLTAADGLLVAESAVTGSESITPKNSQPMIRTNSEIPVSMRSNMVYAASAVVGGFAVGMAVATGKDTLAVAREGIIELSGSDDVPVLEKLSDWSRICSLCLTGAAFIITVAGTAAGGSLFGIFLPCVAMAAACLSEFLVAVGAAAWAFSLKSGGDKVMRSVAAAETAANANVLVLRSPEMLKSTVTTLHSYYRNKKLTLMGTKEAAAPQRLLALACYCTGTTPGGSIANGSFGIKIRHTGPLPYNLVRALWETHGNALSDPGYTIVQHVSAGEESSDGLDSVLLSKNNNFFFCAMGSVSAITDRCTTQRIGNEILPMDEKDRERIADFAKNLKLRGVTLCAVGFRRSHYNSLRRISVLQTGLCFEGFFAVSERIEDGAVSNIEAFRNDGGRVVIFSDGSDEDKYFLMAEGVFKTGDTYLGIKDTASVNSLPHDDGSLAVVCVTGGVAGIKERLRLLKLCKEGDGADTANDKNDKSDKSDKTVFVGSGVGDMWCMQNADVSFAVPDRASGAVPQILRTTADGIVTGEGGGFCGVCEIISKCRLALSNISGILKYLIISHVARLIIMLVMTVASMPTLSAAQLVYWGLLTDFACSAAIAAVPDKCTHMLSKGAHAIPDDAASVLLPTLYGALCALFTVATPFAVRGIYAAAGMQITAEPEALRCTMFACAMLAMPFAAAETAAKNGIFSRDAVWGPMFVLPFAVAALGITVTCIGATSAPFETSFPGWVMLASSALPTALLIAVMSVVRALQNKKNKTDKRANA